MADTTKSQSRRVPLGDATRRVINSLQAMEVGHQQAPHRTNSTQISTISRYKDFKEVELTMAPQTTSPRQHQNTNASISESASNLRSLNIPPEYPASNRNSQVSTVSTNASDGRKIKSMIGPWRLGKTLGRGATARVRLARHIHTAQEAAVKIVQKKNAQMTQAGSLAALDKVMSSTQQPDGLRRMPIGIEREIAIMKLVEHPNIMKLYDIWENRHEIYLVLEYVDQGELFEHIASKGRLHEEEAIKFFRQMLSAVGYCHSMNICHRDLKPENILLASGRIVKIADFGMAALHQGPGYKLRTSCGSPHYAAPELVKGVQYRGDKADMWSLGVILFAMLAGRLPFDVEAPPNTDWIPTLLGLIKRGKYEMEDDFSADARNLIHRILQVNPRDRITIDQVWKHPVVRKYEYLDDLNSKFYDAPNLKDCNRPVAGRADIDLELLRHLRSMWHTMTEDQLTRALISESPNEQKMFYHLFLRYRETQLENYVPDGVVQSGSDYHHVKRGMTRAFATMEFSPAVTRGHNRQTSRFTVISNAADTEHSYDPYKASRPQHLGRHAERAKVTILRGPSNSPISIPTRYSSRHSTRSCNTISPAVFISHSSLASSTRSRNFSVPANYKRGVSFAHIKGKHSGISIGASRHSSYTEVTDDGEFLRPVAPSTQYIRSRKRHSVQSQPLLSRSRPDRSSVLWHEDVRQLSSTLASDCDKAFNRTSIMSDAETVRTSILSYKGSSASWNRLIATPNTQQSFFRNSDIAPPPKVTQALPLVQQPPAASAKKTTGNAMSPVERRTLSAPTDKRDTRFARPLPSISETRAEQSTASRARNASAPEPNQHKGAKDTIRYVLPSSPMSPVKVPRPLVVRKIGRSTAPTAEVDFAKRHVSGRRDQPIFTSGYTNDIAHYANGVRSTEIASDMEQFAGETDDRSPNQSKSSIPSKLSAETFPIRQSRDTSYQKTPLVGKKLKERIVQLFGRKKKETSVAGNSESSKASSQDNSSAYEDSDYAKSSQSLRDRQIEPQQSWIAKLFKIKPLSKLLCFQVSKIHARQEITKVLREWKRYGIRNLQIDKERNIVFANVARENYLNLKEVAFAGEIMTIIEHGVRSHLSIVRFTQEQGAASSFNKVVQTLETVLESRGLLVADEGKKRMMIKTLDAASI